MRVIGRQPSQEQHDPPCDRRRRHRPVGDCHGTRRADTAEHAYIKVLDDNNIHYGTRSHGLAMGHAVCAALDAGEYTPGTVVVALRRDDRLSYDDAAAVAAAAIAMFCPWNKS